MYRKQLQLMPEAMHRTQRKPEPAQELVETQSWYRAPGNERAKSWAERDAEQRAVRKQRHASSGFIYVFLMQQTVAVNSNSRSLKKH